MVVLLMQGLNLKIKTIQTIQLGRFFGISKDNETEALDVKLLWEFY